MNYIQLRKWDNWGYTTYSHPETNQEYSFKNKQRISVRWPDHSTSIEQIEMHTQTHHIYEHGHLHPYAVTDHYPTITAAYKGINITIDDLSEVELAEKNLKPKRGDT